MTRRNERRAIAAELDERYAAGVQAGERTPLSEIPPTDPGTTERFDPLDDWLGRVYHWGFKAGRATREAEVERWAKATGSFESATTTTSGSICGFLLCVLPQGHEGCHQDAAGVQFTLTARVDGISQ